MYTDTGVARTLYLASASLAAGNCRRHWQNDIWVSTSSWISSDSVTAARPLPRRAPDCIQPHTHTHRHRIDILTLNNSWNWDSPTIGNKGVPKIATSYTIKLIFTRSSAIAKGSRDASCQLISCQLPRNSAETTCATSPEQIEVMKLEG